MLHFNTYEHPNSTDWVTFVHGAGGSSSIWFKQVKAFSKHFNVLLLDLRGHGKSKKLSLLKGGKYTFEKVGDDIIEVLDHLKISSTHFIGISLGTIIVRELTERYPERTASMILGGAVMKLNTRGQVLMGIGNALKSIMPYLLLYRLLAFVIMPKKRNKESRSLFVREAKKLYQKEFQKWFGLAAQVNPLLKFFREKDSGKPTLYIMGEEDYMFLPSIKKLATMHPSSKLDVIKDCGHVVNIEQPNIFNSRAIDFIKAV